MSYSNSKLVDYTKRSPNNSGTRKYPISRITIHCTAFPCTVETLGRVFYKDGVKDPKNGTSSNYGIGDDGRVGLYCDEAHRSWCSANADNDHRAVTIEVSSGREDPYPVTEAAYAKLLDLGEDIARRNGKTRLVWIPDKDTALAYQPKDNELLMTVHRWFANKACPGEYLFSRHGEIADTINKRLSQNDKEYIYRVQVGAFKNRQYAEDFLRLVREDFPDAYMIRSEVK